MKGPPPGAACERAERALGYNRSGHAPRARVPRARANPRRGEDRARFWCRPGIGRGTAFVPADHEADVGWDGARTCRRDRMSDTRMLRPTWSEPYYGPIQPQATEAIVGTAHHEGLR